MGFSFFVIFSSPIMKGVIFIAMCVFLIIFGFAMLWADRVYTDYRNDKQKHEEDKPNNQKQIAKK